MAEVKDKKMRTVGYIIVDGNVGFLNYRNKVFKSVPMNDIVERFKKEIEEMADKRINRV